MCISVQIWSLMSKVWSTCSRQSLAVSWRWISRTGHRLSRFRAHHMLLRFWTFHHWTLGDRIQGPSLYCWLNSKALPLYLWGWKQRSSSFDSCCWIFIAVAVTVKSNGWSCVGEWERKNFDCERRVSIKHLPLVICCTKQDIRHIRFLNPITFVIMVWWAGEYVCHNYWHE